MITCDPADRIEIPAQAIRLATWYSRWLSEILTPC
jgi:hypothetical protein